MIQVTIRNTLREIIKSTYRSIPHTNQDKRSCPHNDRFHIQSINLIDRSTLVYNNVSGPGLSELSQVRAPAASHATSRSCPCHVLASRGFASSGARCGALPRHCTCHRNVPGPCNVTGPAATTSLAPATAHCICSRSQILPRNDPGTCSTSQTLPRNDLGTCSTSQILPQNDPGT